MSILRRDRLRAAPVEPTLTVTLEVVYRAGEDGELVPRSSTVRSATGPLMVTPDVERVLTQAAKLLMRPLQSVIREALENHGLEANPIGTRAALAAVSKPCAECHERALTPPLEGLPGGPPLYSAWRQYTADLARALFVGWRARRPPYDLDRALEQLRLEQRSSTATAAHDAARLDGEPRS